MFSAIIINRFDYNTTVHSMHFSSSHYLQVIYRTGFLPPFFDVHVIYRLPFSIYMLFTGSLFRFTCSLWAPFLISMLFTDSLFRFTRYLKAPFFDVHVIYRLPFLMYTLFTGSCFHFQCYLQPPFFLFTCCLQPPLFIYMLFTVLWQPPCIKFTCYLRVSRLNHKKFTGYLQAIYSICRNSLHVIYMILALCVETFTVFSSSFTCFTWNIYMFFTWNIQNM